MTEIILEHHFYKKLYFLTAPTHTPTHKKGIVCIESTSESSAHIVSNVHWFSMQRSILNALLQTLPTHRPTITKTLIWTTKCQGFCKQDIGDCGQAT